MIAVDDGIDVVTVVVVVIHKQTHELGNVLVVSHRLQMLHCLRDQLVHGVQHVGLVPQQGAAELLKARVVQVALD